MLAFLLEALSEPCEDPSLSAVWLCADCMWSSATRWGTLNRLCLTKCWQTEHRCCWRPEKYWKLLNQHNSQNSVASRAGMGVPGQKELCKPVLFDLEDARSLLLLPSTMALGEVFSKGQYCKQCFLPSNYCLVCWEGSWLRAVSLIPFMMLSSQDHGVTGLLLPGTIPACHKPQAQGEREIANKFKSL